MQCCIFDFWCVEVCTCLSVSYAHQSACTLFLTVWFVPLPFIIMVSLPSFPHVIILLSHNASRACLRGNEIQRNEVVSHVLKSCPRNPFSVSPLNFACISRREWCQSRWKTRSCLREKPLIRRLILFLLENIPSLPPYHTLRRLWQSLNHHSRRPMCVNSAKTCSTIIIFRLILTNQMVQRDHHVLLNVLRKLHDASKRRRDGVSNLRSLADSIPPLCMFVWTFLENRGSDVNCLSIFIHQTS